VEARGVIGEILDRGRNKIDAAFTMKKIIDVSEQVLERARITHVRAPQLRRVVDALMQLEDDPSDTKAKVKVALLEKQGARNCPACRRKLELHGYRITRTHYGEKHTLSCAGCRTAFVVEETQIV
jgi:hypothetical protein